MEQQRFEEHKEWEGEADGECDVGEELVENPQEVLKECLEKFRTRDYIMEPGIFTQLKRYFQAGGNPVQVIELLSLNYSAVAQMANLLAEWLITAGLTVTDVQAMVENHVKDMVLKTFDPKKADTIFTEEGETPAWLTEMIDHPTWRSLIYRLAEEYPDCLMLNFTIKLISDAGFQGEITSISTAAQQIEVFSRVLKTAISGFLQNNEDWYGSVQECAKMVCHGQHTYVYSQVLLQVLSQEPKGGSNMKRLSQEIVRCAQKNHHDVTPITMALNGASAYPQACQALTSMLSRNSLNPADITVLYRNYSAVDPPPIDLIRTPQFLDLLVDSLFKPGVKLNPEHKPKYIYLLAYAASVCETSTRKGQVRKNINKDELKPTIQAIEKVHSVCNLNKGSTELIAEIAAIYQCIRFPVVSVGLVRWVESTVTEPSYFKLCVEHTPIHLALLDEVVTCHMLLHPMILSLLVRLFESKQDELEILVQLEMRKMLLDRMVNLLSRGCVVPVVKYIKQCWQKGDTDISLIRYFVTEVLEAIAPPYTAEFVQLFLPMVENEEITGSMRGDGENDPVSEFIGEFQRKCSISHTAVEEESKTSCHTKHAPQRVSNILTEKNKAYFIVSLACLQFLRHLICDYSNFLPLRYHSAQFQAVKIMNELSSENAYTVIKMIPVKHNIFSELKLSSFSLHMLYVLMAGTTSHLFISKFMENKIVRLGKNVAKCSKISLKPSNQNTYGIGKFLKHKHSAVSNVATFIQITGSDEKIFSQKAAVQKFKIFCGQKRVKENKWLKEMCSSALQQSRLSTISGRRKLLSTVNNPQIYLHKIKGKTGTKTGKQNVFNKTPVLTMFAFDLSTQPCCLAENGVRDSISKITSCKSLPENSGNTLKQKIVFRTKRVQHGCETLSKKGIKGVTSKSSLKYGSIPSGDLLVNDSPPLQNEFTLFDEIDKLAAYEEEGGNISWKEKVENMEDNNQRQQDISVDDVFIDPSKRNLLINGMYVRNNVSLSSDSYAARMKYLGHVTDAPETAESFEEFVQIYNEDDDVNTANSEMLYGRLAEEFPSCCLPNEVLQEWDKIIILEEEHIENGCLPVDLLKKWENFHISKSEATRDNGFLTDVLKKWSLRLSVGNES